MKRLCAYALAALVWSGSPPIGPAGPAVAHAAERGKTRARKAKGKAARPRTPRPSPAAQPAPADTTVDPAPADETPAPATASAPAPRAAGKPRVYTFGGLDLEGKLKTPQLLYFRGRMRQELDASSLQRRSFLKELEKTADDQGL